MQLIPHSSIVVDKRQRKTFDEGKLDELGNSIVSNGLLHPITVIFKEGVPHLVAGERRLRAVRKLTTSFKCNDEVIPLGMIPVLSANDADELKLFEAELAENLQRVDLPWQEKVQALDELHKLRIAQNPQQTIADTAREVAVVQSVAPSTARERVHRAVLIADNLDNPNVAKAKDETAAYKYLLAKAEADLQAELAKRSLLKVRKHTLIHGDFREHAPSLPGNVVLTIADPPYGMGADQFGNAAQLAHSYADDEKTAFAIAEVIFGEAWRLSADNAHFYMFCDFEFFIPLREMSKQFGWRPWRKPVIWYKSTSAAHAPEHERGFRHNYETILFCRKGDKPFSQVFSDVIEYAQESDKAHAAQKPVGLYQTLIRRSCLPGDRVLDPCCGSGTIFPAAEATGTIATGVELDEAHYKTALVRLDEACRVAP